MPVRRFRDALRYVKYLVLIWAVAGAAYWGVMVFREYDPWAALWNLTEWSIGFGTLVLGLTLVGLLFIERPWCRYACPLGAETGLVGMLSPVQLRREGAVDQQQPRRRQGLDDD